MHTSVHVCAVERAAAAYARYRAQHFHKFMCFIFKMASEVEITVFSKMRKEGPGEIRVLEIIEIGA